jgi:TonB family protein
MCGLSAVAHVVVVVAIVAFTTRSGFRPPPMVAYTVEITDPNALGGRLPPGAPGKDLAGGATRPEPRGENGPPPAPPEPVAKAEPPPAVKPPEPPPPEPTPQAKPPEPKAPEVKLPDVKPEPKPEPKPVPKAEAKPVEPKPVARPEPTPEPKPAPKPEAKPAEPKPEAKPEAKKPETPQADAARPDAAAKAPAGKPAATPGSPSGTQEAAPRDAYAAAAERWRSKAAGTGGGLGGAEGGSGPIGIGGEGPGGGGQQVGLEFLAYHQQVISTIKARWTNVISRPGLVAFVRFQIAPDGAVSDVEVAQSSGNAAYDSSIVRAVQQSNPLQPPPARYAKEFREFVIEVHSEERGGQEGR